MTPRNNKPIVLLLIEPKGYWEELGVAEEIESQFIVTYGCLRIGAITNLFLNGKIDGVLTCNYHSHLSRYLSFLAGKLQIPTFYFMDGIGDYANFVRNEYTKKVGVKQLIPVIHSTVFCVDGPTKSFVLSQGASSYQYFPKRVYPVMSDLVVCKYDILITTANNPVYDVFELESLLELINSTVVSAEAMGLGVVFRIFDDELLTVLNIPVGKNLIDCTLAQALGSARMLFSTPSSVVMPAFLADMPIAIFDYRDSPLFVQSGWRVHGSVDINMVLKSMLAREPDRMFYQRSLIKDDGKVSERILSDIVEMKALEMSSLEHGFYQSRFTFSLEYVFRKILLVAKRNKFVKNFIYKLKNMGVH
jgi:hypothetical protein